MFRYLIVKSKNPLKVTRILLSIYAVFFCCELSGQQLNGTVFDQSTRERVPGAHVTNKSSLKGTITNFDGTFSINLEFGDTIVFSSIGYQYFYFIYLDSTLGLENVLIPLKEQNYLLDEISVFSYELTTNNPKQIPLSKPIYPSSNELNDPSIMDAGIANPAELLYNLFGNKPRQLRELARLKAEDKYREKLEHSNNRKAVTQLTGLSQDELEAFMFYCKFSSVRMNTLNDYQFLLSVQNCYRQYVKEKELDDFLEQFD